MSRDPHYSTAVRGRIPCARRARKAAGRGIWEENDRSNAALKRFGLDHEFWLGLIKESNTELMRVGDSREMNSFPLFLRCMRKKIRILSE